MAISWRLFERNVGTEMNMIVIPIVMALVGVALMVSGSSSEGVFGFCVGALLVGWTVWLLPMFLWRASRSELSTAHRLESRALATAINYSLKAVLQEMGVDLDEVQILVHSSSLDVSPFEGPVR